MNKLILIIIGLVVLLIASYFVYSNNIKSQKQELLSNIGILLSSYNLDRESLLNNGKIEVVNYRIEHEPIGKISSMTDKDIAAFITCNSEFLNRNYPVTGNEHKQFDCRIGRIGLSGEKEAYVDCECFYLKAT